MNPGDVELRDLLQGSGCIAVVGLSDDPARPSHRVARYLRAQGYEIWGVNPHHAGVMLFGRPCVARLAEVTSPIDIVEVFRRTDAVLPIARQAIERGARCLWQQLGVLNVGADMLVRAAGMVSVTDRCLMVDHQRLIGPRHETRPQSLR